MYFLKTIDTSEVEKRMNIIIADIIADYKDDLSLEHLNKYPIPSRENIIAIVHEFFKISFPGYFTTQDINDVNIDYVFGNKIHHLFKLLCGEIAKALRHEFSLKKDLSELHDECLSRSIEVTLYLLEHIPQLRRLLSKDVQAAYDGDPAAKSFSEIIFSYPGLFAITIYRFTHLLYQQNIPLLPRVMSEYAHSISGIDIHPGAKIGESFFIDHGTGVVIGETCVIGNQVKIYQGVTLGALSFPKDNRGKVIKGRKRHPTIEDHVTIYAGATILGGETVIGKNSVIGGNVWLVSSIPPNSKVLLTDSGTGVKQIIRRKHVQVVQTKGEALTELPLG